MTLNKTDRIVITLGKQIVHGKYVPGSPLPAEAELCEEFATSRNIIREVFRSLIAGRLWLRVTSGITSTLTYCNGCWKTTTIHGLSVP